MGLLRKKSKSPGIVLVTNLAGVPLLIFDDVVGVGDAVAEGVVGSYGAGDAAASLRADFWRCGTLDGFFGGVDVADQFRFCRPE